MGLFFWKKNNVIDQFANDLANELYSDIQPQLMAEYFSGEESSGVKQFGKRVQNRLGVVVKVIQQFRLTHSLGVYGKARLQLKLNERLQELGYEKDVIDKLNRMILLRAAK